MPYKKARVDSSKIKKKAKTGGTRASLVKTTKTTKPKKLSLKEAADRASWQNFKVKDFKTGKIIYKSGYRSGQRQKDL